MGLFDIEDLPLTLLKSQHFLGPHSTDILPVVTLFHVASMFATSGSNLVDILQHLVVKFVNLIFKELANLPTGTIDLVLALQPTVLHFVQVLDQIKNRVTQHPLQVLLPRQVQVLLHQMPQSHFQQKMQSVHLIIQFRRIHLPQLVILPSQFLVPQDVDSVRPQLVHQVEVPLLHVTSLTAKLTTRQIRSPLLLVSEGVAGGGSLKNTRVVFAVYHLLFFLALETQLVVELYHFEQEEPGAAGGDKTLEKGHRQALTTLRVENSHSLLVHVANISACEELKIFPEKFVKLHEAYLVLECSAEDLVEEILHFEEFLSPNLPVDQQQQFQQVIESGELKRSLHDFALVQVVADEVLDVPAKLLSNFDDDPLGLVELYQLGRVPRVDKVLELAPLQKFVPAHQVEIHFVFLVLPQQHVSEHLHLRNVLNPLVHQAPDQLHVRLLYLVLRKVARNEIRLLLSLVDLVAPDVTVAKLREPSCMALVHSVVDVFAVEDGPDFDEQGGFDDDVLQPGRNGLLPQQDQVVGVVQLPKLFVLDWSGYLRFPSFSAFADSASQGRTFLFVCPQPIVSLQYLQVLEDVLVDTTVGDILVFINFVQYLPEVFLVILLLVNVENYSAAYQRRQHIQFVLHLLELQTQIIVLLQSLVVLQLETIQLLPTHLQPLSQRIVTIQILQLHLSLPQLLLLLLYLPLQLHVFASQHIYLALQPIFLVVKSFILLHALLQQPHVHLGSFLHLVPLALELMVYPIRRLFFSGFSPALASQTFQDHRHQPYIVDIGLYTLLYKFIFLFVLLQFFLQHFHLPLQSLHLIISQNLPFYTLGAFVLPLLQSVVKVRCY